MNAQDYQGITASIEQREKARTEKRWAEADAIRDDLQAHGVQVMDREDLWKCGPMVGLYNLTYNIKDGAIRVCMEMREEARIARDYATSDAIRDMLKEAGIEIKDREGIWWSTRDGRRGNLVDTARGVFDQGSGFHHPRQSGVSFGSGGSNARYRSRSPVRASPTQSLLNQTVIPMTGHTSSAVAQQMAAVGTRKNNGGFAMAAAAGAQGSSSGSRSASVMLRLQDFLVKREEMRNQREFEAADKIRDVLQMVGVHLKDKERRWTAADGRSGDFPSVAR